MEKPITTWQQGTPFSEEFNDIYFNPKEGLSESHYVFFQHNNLKKRFSHTRRFTIGELGFGTGLNFFHTAQQFLALSPPDAQLDFMSVEAYPLPPETIRQAVSQYPQLSDVCHTLLAQYPPAITGFHRLILYQGRIRLTLLFGHAADMLSQWVGHIDAWFLDGFSPNKNPDMWSRSLLEKMANLSHPNTTFSTFTAANSVRKNLIEVGFAVHKGPGFSRKRNMLYGQFTKPKSKANIAPWCGLYTKKYPEHVAVIGGGLAGCAAAYCLTQRGIPTTLIEAQLKVPLATQLVC